MKHIIYCRKSTESEDRQVLSIESQTNEMKRLAERDGVAIDKIFTESMSAKAPGRPVFKEVMAYIEKHGQCILYVWKLDRLARNALDGGQLSWFMDRKLIVEIRTFEKIYKNISDDKFFMSLDFGIAKKYVDDLSTNVKRGIRTKVEKGGWPTKAPFGYLNDKANKIIYPDPVRAPLIVEMFNLYVTGNYSIKDLVNIMYEKGLRTLGGYKVHKSVLHRTLTNPVHCGFVVRDGKYFVGTHASIIVKEVFDNVQNIINGKNKSRKQTHNFLHRGFMNCHVCGCALTATEKKGYTYYYCTNGKGNCEQHKKYLRSECVEHITAEIFSDIEFAEETIEIMYLAKKEELVNDLTYTETAIQNLAKQLLLAREKQSKLVDSYLVGNIAEDLYNAKIQALNNEVTATGAQLATLQTKHARSEVTLEQTKDKFLTACRAKKEFLQRDDLRKRKVLGNILWNVTIQDKNLASFKLKNPLPTNGRGLQKLLFCRIVGLTGLEPAISCTPCRRDSQLRYSP